MDVGYEKKVGFCLWGFSIFNHQERGFSTFCVEKKRRLKFF